LIVKKHAHDKHYGSWVMVARAQFGAGRVLAHGPYSF